ncbi:MAG: YicC/YloC family endoribonuclease [Beijerinckiaceae bacterium]|jgi:uncharacterized protein (TIGR00255 family)
MINSMTGFASAAGTTPNGRWSWEIKTVNAKGLDVRLRVPPGFDAVEIEARRMIGARLARGTCHATLSIVREAPATQVRVNMTVLRALMRELDGITVPPTIRSASLDGILSLRGVIETLDALPDEGVLEALRSESLVGLDGALTALSTMRAGEGKALLPILQERLDAIARLTETADKAPQRQAAAVREKLAQSIAALTERFQLDPDRLHQEALILAAKADVREELDRLAAHTGAARELLAAAGAVGRRLDFLAQELAREANTFCAKANDAALTAIGLELRVEIEQFREQVQNIE